MSDWRDMEAWVDQARKCIRVWIDLLGMPQPHKEHLYGFVPGIGMADEVRIIEERWGFIGNGPILEVLVEGGFVCGKSTLLNALMRKERLCTSIIPYKFHMFFSIEFGQGKKVVVHEWAKDHDRPLAHETTWKDFIDAYRLSPENSFNKHENIDYVQLQLPGEGIGSPLVRLVDSPAIECDYDSMYAMINRRRFEENANAIVYVIDAVVPFKVDDKDYIEKHYVGKHMRNIFFVFNRFDSLSEQAQEELKARVPEQLHDVFTDESGNFDQALFDSRVFYTDAYHSLMARTGKKVKTPFGMMPCDDSLTGVPEFQAALGNFLIQSCRNLLHWLVADLAGFFVMASNRCYDEVYWLREEEKRAAKLIEVSPSDTSGSFEKWKNTVEIRRDAEVCAGKVRQILLDSVSSLWKTMEGSGLTGIQFWQMASNQL